MAKYGEVLGSVVGVCRRHPNTGQFRAVVRVGFNGKPTFDCPHCGRGYVKGAEGWMSDRPFTPVTEDLI